MTQADEQFIKTCKEIIEHGFSSEGTGVRTRWEDGAEANYYSIVGVQNKYDVGKEFPMITLRNNSKTIKNAIDEILWIWQKKSNKIEDLHSHIWDQWAGEDGTIGKAYGYQLGKKYEFKTKEGIKVMDQVDYCLYLLKHDPARRSQDMLTANGWNVMQYAALQCMFAQVSGLEVGTLTHNIGDCHIYDRHIPLVKQLLEATPVDVVPKLVIKNPTKDFYEFKVEDFEVQNYDYNKEVKIGKIPVAI